MKVYKLVLRVRDGKFYAFYVDVDEPPVYDFQRPWGYGATATEAIKSARKTKPKDGIVGYVYIDKDES